MRNNNEKVSNLLSVYHSETRNDIYTYHLDLFSFHGP